MKIFLTAGKKTFLCCLLCVARASAPVHKQQRAMKHKENCRQLEAGEYAKARTAIGLDNSRLSISAMFNDSIIVVVGFFTSFIYTRIAALAPANHQSNMALLVLAITALSFVIVRFFVNSLGPFFWHYNREWWMLMMRIAQFSRTVLLFLVTHFLGALFNNWWAERHLSWLEALAAIYLIVLTVYFLLDLFHDAD